MTIRKPHILITNDDGIESPGLKAAVKAVMKLGMVMVLLHSLSGIVFELSPADYSWNGKIKKMLSHRVFT